MARLSRFVAVAVLLGGATVSLSGCTGDSDPVVTPSVLVTAATPSPSVSPSPAALSDEELVALIPEEARLENFGSAVSFARFFLLEYHRMFVEKDPSLFRFASGAECEFCASALDSYDVLISAGGRTAGGDMSVDAERATGGLRDDGYWYVGVPFTAAPNSDYAADGELLDEGAGATGQASLQLEWREARWSVAGVEIDAA